LRPFVGKGRPVGHAKHLVIARSEATKQSLSYSRTNQGALPPSHGLLRSARNDERGALPNHNGVQRRAGFTLVEVIVVLVILAILAAIAIPALTGYINKARDKQYIAEARNISVAIKTVLTEAYASGEINDVYYDYTDEIKSSMDAFTIGYAVGKDFGVEEFAIGDISEIVYALAGSVPGSSNSKFYARAAALTGETFVIGDHTRFWEYMTIAKTGSGATAATADGFVCYIYPEGATEGAPAICVTYKLKRIDSEDDGSFSDFIDELETVAEYDPHAGYEVYKLIQLSRDE
jgi:prepilin-type N-terminal cleavage/methylation domain-containing protein